MNRSHLLALFSLLLLVALPLRAEDPAAADADAVPPGSTVITSDELHSDQTTHTSVFTGNVVVQGTNFNLTCLEMTVIFSKDNKVDQIIATGHVVITQPDRITQSDEARYFRDGDKFVLTGRPEIVDHKNKITATIITIYRTTQKMETSGPGKTRAVLTPNSTTPNGDSGSGTTPPPAGNP